MRPESATKRADRWFAAFQRDRSDGEAPSAIQMTISRSLSRRELVEPPEDELARADWESPIERTSSVAAWIVSPGGGPTIGNVERNEC